MTNENSHSLNMQLILGDCLEAMNVIPDKSVDMILCDLPYGTTQNQWDSVIPFDLLWQQYNRIAKENEIKRLKEENKQRIAKAIEEEKKKIEMAIQREKEHQESRKSIYEK